MDAKLLWEPSAQRIADATLTRFARAVGREGTYDDLWRWSVEDLEGLWAAVWHFCDVRASVPYERVLGRREMPGAQWFPGARLSYAEHFFRDRDDDAVAIRHASELRELSQWTWGELREQAAQIATGLRRRGVGPGDRVAAYLPNIPETVAAFMATASIGAVWSSAAPEFGARSVIDRFAQIEPKVLLAVDGYRYGGRDFDRREVADAIAAEVGAPVVSFGYLDGSGWPADLVAEPEPMRFEQLPFEHPLWVLYSSGTTGLPKPIVQSQGGILLEHLKLHNLHLDCQEGDRVFWFTTTGWMMWNFLVGVLLTPASIVLYDGSPAAPDLGVLWDLAERTGMTTFGTSASYIATCMKGGVEPGDGRDLSALRAVGSTGSPLRPRALSGSTSTSAPTRGCSRPAAAPTCARRSSAACPRFRSTRASCRRAPSAARSRHSTRTATRWSKRSASWC